MASLTAHDRAIRDFHILDELANTLDDKSRHEWANCGSSHRFLASVGTRLVVYRALFDNPIIICPVECTDVALHPTLGLHSKWTLAKELHRVSHVPRRLAEGVFLAHTPNSNVLYEKYRGEYRLRFSMLYRQFCNPDMAPDGTLHILEASAFEKKFGAKA